MNPTPFALKAPIAAIDIGSNSFRLEVAQIKGDTYRKLDYLKVPVRLGVGLNEQGFLSPQAFDVSIETLKQFAMILRRYELAGVRAVATQTLREAKNRDDFLGQAEKVLGCPIEVISGREEARLIFAGVSYMHPTSQSRLVVDIGGRSTEMVVGKGAMPGVAESFGLGSQSITARYFADGQLTAAAFRAAQIAVGAELEEAQALFAQQRWKEVMASSGTAGAVSQLLAGHGITDGRIHPNALAWCIERCVEAGKIQNLRLRGLKEDRRPVIAGGLSILYTLMVQFKIDEILPAKAALREGVIVDLHHRLAALQSGAVSDMRDESVKGMQARFGVDIPHAISVREHALKFLNQLMPHAPIDLRQELGWVCDLHEIGMMISHHDHHRHSAYLMAHMDAPGFSQSQQRRMADMVLGQRGGLRKLEEACANRSFSMVLLCLRLAVLCCHARHVEHEARLTVEMDRSGLIEVKAQNPDLRTQYLMQEEMAAWAKHDLLKVSWEG